MVNNLIRKGVWFKIALPIILLLSFFLIPGCTVFKRVEDSNPERIISENLVKFKSIVLQNGDTIIINRSVALVEVNKAFIKVRYFSGDTLMLLSSEIRSVVARYKDKSATIIVNSALGITALALAAGIIVGIGLLFYLLALGGTGW